MPTPKTVPTHAAASNFHAAYRPVTMSANITKDACAGTNVADKTDNPPKKSKMCNSCNIVTPVYKLWRILLLGKGGVAEQDGLTADGKWVFLVRLRRGKLDKLLVHQIVKGNLPFPLPFKLQNLVQGGTADNSLAKGVVPALDIFLIGYLVGHGNSPF
jgi:hypothetical protein